MKIENVSLPKAKFGTRHVQTILLSLALLIAYGIRISLSVAIVAMTDAKSTNSNFKEYKWGPKEKSLVLSSFLWGSGLTQIPSGYLATTWSAQKVFSIGTFFAGIIYMMIPLFADWGGWILVCFSRVAIGVLQGGLIPCIHTLVSKWAPPNERSRISTFISTGSALGTVAAMGLSGVIAASNLGWPSIFYTFGSASVFMGIVLFFKVSDSPSVHPTIDEDEKKFIMESLWQSDTEIESRPKIPWREILTSRPAWGLNVVHAGYTWGSWILLTGIPAYMKTVLNFGIAETGMVSALPYLSLWVVGFPSSWLADYAMSKNVSRGTIRRIWNTVGMWLPAIGLVLLCFVDSFDKVWPILTLVVAVGLKASITSGFYDNYIDLSPNFSGTLFSISNCFSTIISIIAPILVGAIVQDSTDPGPWHLVFYITAFVYFISNLIFIVFARGKTQPWNYLHKKHSIISNFEPKILSTEP